MRTITKMTVLAFMVAVFMSAVASADTVTLYPTDDAYVWGADPGTNFGDFDYLVNGANPGLTGLLFTLFKFDLSAYSGVSINSADLRLYVFDSYGGWPPNSVYLSMNESDWDEDSVTWNSLPGMHNTHQLSVPTSYDWWVIDVTDMVQDFVDGTYDNYGFQLWRVEAFYTIFLMRSKEYGSNIPKLVLDFPAAVESTSLGEIKAVFK